MNKEDLTELQKMQVAYAHFTLEEWQTLAACVSHCRAYFRGTPHGPDQQLMLSALQKFPSAVL